MSKLLSAEFVRLAKSLIFKLCLLFSAGLGAFSVMMRWADVKKHPAEYAQLPAEYSNADGLIFVGGLYIIFAVAVFIGIFVGTEYSDGTIRNKLFTGHTRIGIYLSKLIVCAAADVMIHVLYILVVLALGGLLLGGTSMAAQELLVCTLVSTAASLAQTSLFLLFSMSIQSKTVGSVVCLLSSLILLIATLTVYQRLEQPEYYDGYTYTVVDEYGEEIEKEVEREKNPNYLTGMHRKVYEFLNDFLPSSQIYQIMTENTDKFGWMSVYDCAVILVTTGAGIVIFQKKNLK